MRVWRVRSHSQEQRLRILPYGVLSWVSVWMSVCFLVFTIGQPYRWRLKESASTQLHCPHCDCYCSSTEFLFSLLDCGKNDPILNEEMNKDILTMLSEELKLQKIVANETFEHTKRLVMDARKTLSRYKKETEKCSMGIETCEEARERAQAELVEEQRLTVLWENRAREYGWKDRRRTHQRS